ncbi:MAG: P-II family nitrogen regulator [Finegoldia sp.]|nr:P-II family nitrogen regulator [Finegoldia sp.]
MNNNDNFFELVFAIVDCGKGTKVLKEFKNYGIEDGTIVRAEGTLSSRLLHFFCIYSEEKELVMMASEEDTAAKAMEKMKDDLKLDKPNHGIIFSTDLIGIYGSRAMVKDLEDKGDNQSMYKLITTVVNMGSAEDVVEAANQMGAHGGTVIHARGGASDACKKFLNMEIETEKEVVLIIAKDSDVQAIAKNIADRLKLDKAGNGIIFVQDVKRVYGLYDQNN